MKKGILVLLYFISLFSLFSIEYVPGELIVKTKQKEQLKQNRFQSKRLNDVLRTLPIEEIKSIYANAESKYFLLKISNEPSLQQFKEQLIDSAEFEFVQFNYINELYRVPNDPYYYNQKIYLDLINASKAWDKSTGSHQILVGLVDSGINFSHPDLQANIYINPNEIPDNGIDDDENGFIDDVMGWDFVDAPGMIGIGLGDYIGQDSDASDEIFHGTHVAGIIGAGSNNNEGICGTAWKVKILPVRAGFKTSGGQGFLEDDDAAAAIIYSADMGCQVINLSWGDRNYSPIIEDACNYAYNKGSIIIASAGNTPEPVISYPAKLQHVIAVGAVDNFSQLTGFSSYGPELDIVAPGQEILSTFSDENQYFNQSGTSMSAPFVSGAVALLLSINNQMSFEQVKSRLHASAKDLGQSGFDNYFGAGLLDMYKLLMISNTYELNITHPLDHSFLDNTFDILGTVDAPDFFRYSLSYTDKENPSSIDWKDISTHQNTPGFIYQIKHDEVLGQFYIPSLFKDGQYRLRLRVELRNGDFYDHYSTFFIDRLPPVIDLTRLSVQERWNNHRLDHYLTMSFDEKVNVQFDCRIYNNSSLTYTDEFSLFSAQADSVFYIKIPDVYQHDILNVKVFARDLANHISISEEFIHLHEFKMGEILNYDYLEQEISSGLMFARNTFDFDNDLQQDIVGMEIGNSINGSVHVFSELNQTFVQSFTFSEQFNPLYLGDSNQQKIELLGLKSDRLELYEALGSLVYPDLPIWSLNDVEGAFYFDFTGDGTSEIIVNRNLPDQTMIELYQREGNQFYKNGSIANNTATDKRRGFVAKLTGGNLDNDSYPDLLCADTDGDVMIYEWINNAPVLSWTTRLSVPNAYYLSCGDFDGDQNNDFIVGAYIKETDAAKSFWHFELYENTGNNQYQKLSEINFHNVITGQSSISQADIDNDGQDELIVSIVPYVYIIKYEDQRLWPIWVSSSDKTYQIVAIDKNDYNSGGFFINKETDGELRSYFVSKKSEFTGPPTPQYLKSEILSEHSVQISWNSIPDMSYRIYRKQNINGVLELVAESDQNYFVNDGLETDSLYYYAVSAVNDAYDPQESYLSNFISVRPHIASSLIDGEMLSQTLILLTFDKALNSSSIIPSHFTVSNSEQSINPSSVNTFSNNKKILLHFRNALNVSNDFSLHFHHLISEYGLPVEDHTIEIAFQVDSEAPYLLESKVLNPRSISLKFSELLDERSINNPSFNFIIESAFPEINYNVISASLSDSTIYLELDNELLQSLKKYWINFPQIYDLAGNKILNNQGRCSLSLTEIRDLSFMVVYPNPLKLKEFEEVRFVNLPENQKGEVKIYNIAGELVFTSKIEQSSEFIWDVKNNHGQSLSSGIYFYLLRIGDQLKKGKIVVIH